MLGEPALRRARLADQEQRPVGHERRDGDFDQPLVADVFGGDLAFARLAAADVGVDGPRRHSPAGRFFVLVLLDQRVDFVREKFLRRRPQNRRRC